MRVRARTTADLDDLVEVAARVRAVDLYPLYLPDDDLHRFLTRPVPLSAWVAEVDHRVVGHVSLNSESNPQVMKVLRQSGITGDVGVVARLLVEPAARRRGLGALLLEQARSEAEAQGRTPVLDVVASATSAIALYR
ncbi:MAG: GNAT family N-acetyltransferase, partial [Nitrososphaerales archaeon]